MAYHKGMANTVTIDQSGRLVIPAKIRKALALAPGTELDCTIEGESIRLEPIGGAKLERRASRLVITSPLVGEVPDHREIREERINREDEAS